MIQQQSSEDLFAVDKYCWQIRKSRGFGNGVSFAQRLVLFRTIKQNRLQGIPTDTLMAMRTASKIPGLKRAPTWQLHIKTALWQLPSLMSSENALNNGNVNRLRNTDDEKKGKDKSGSQMNMKGVYLHIITDFIGSVIVIFTASISLWLPEMTIIKLYMDPVLSMIMVLLIMISTIPLVHETALILLQTTPNNVDLKKLEEQLVQIPGVFAVHEFHVWRLVGVRIIATVHVRFRSLEDYMQSAEQIKDIFHLHKIHSVTIQPEFPAMTGKEKGDGECMLQCEPENCPSRYLLSNRRKIDFECKIDKAMNFCNFPTCLLFSFTCSLFGIQHLRYIY
ncbi:hypothetical protein M3Y97_00797200 [Aphelenchoides bicaudatus]|nr:hypothetical protein M3Y97_00797200 [Aphelenchoides bicaudatus]